MAPLRAGTMDRTRIYAALGLADTITTTTTLIALTWLVATRSSGVYLYSGGITLLLLSLAAIAIHAIHAAYRRETTLDKDRAILGAANHALELAKAQADAKTSQLEATLAGMSDGVAMIDGNLQLVEW